jgi:cell division protein FtsQ
MRRLLRILPYVLLPVLTVLLLGASSVYQGSKPCTRVAIEIELLDEHMLVDAAEVRRLLGPEQNLIGAPVAEVQLAAIEQRLMTSSFIRRADAWFDAQGALNVRIGLRKPIARVLTEEGKSFYIDEEGHPMRLSSTYSARCFLVRGAFRQGRMLADTVADSSLRAMVPLLQQLYKHPVLAGQIAEVVQEPDGNVTLYPEVGSLVVHFGPVERVPEKLAHLMEFYQQVLPRVGNAYYRSVSVAYAGQIVAQRTNTLNIN